MQRLRGCRCSFTDRTLHYKGGVRNIRGLLGKVQEDDRLDIFGGGQGRVNCMLHEAVQYAHGPGGLGSCNEDQLLGFIKAIAVRGVHKEVHRAAFQSMHQ